MLDPLPTAAFEATRSIAREDLHGVLASLNARVPFRFTGVYRFDGALLCNVALFDRLSPVVPRGADAPLGETYCAITGRMNDALLVSDGRRDPRYPWMRANAVISYCGVPIRSDAGTPLGTLCHFDLAAWPAQGDEAGYLLCIADLFRHCLD
ncbi:GAF domain-containing protein [Ramlibacter algicola]|uniref:GAF domain-containing protein n=1 Tax=Ramlibacter algicola TaxID=2795217 RepID=A0A934UQQ8_9BURK|nr:GAF domain-containing protein [Ramlibacter algicola]MBK0392380.1 GAF domain-containing protein [Ramlibacter algicola]